MLDARWAELLDGVRLEEGRACRLTGPALAVRGARAPAAVGVCVPLGALLTLPLGTSRLLRPRSCAGARRRRRRRHRQVPAACGPLSESPDGLHAPLPREDLASARPPPAAGARTAAAHPGGAQPGRRRISGLGRRAHRRTSTVRYARALAAADHVLYQSEFCKRSADEFLGEPHGTWEVLYNAVDVDRFTPAATPPADGPVLLLGGDQTQAYRLEVALRTFALVVASEPQARLLVTGRLVSSPDALLDELGLRDSVEFVGRYSQREAPNLIRRAHLLLHTKVKDPCPSAVIEAMACGLPGRLPGERRHRRARRRRGGDRRPAPTLVARDEPPAPEALARAVELVLSERRRYAESARDAGRRSGSRSSRGSSGMQRLFAPPVCSRNRSPYEDSASAGERRQVKPGASTVEHRDRTKSAADGPTEHRAERPDADRVVLAQDEADAGAVARRPRADPRSAKVLFSDARPRRTDRTRCALRHRGRANEVVDLLAGMTRPSRAEAELLVERTDLFDDRPAQEDGERDRAVPDGGRA